MKKILLIALMMGLSAVVAQNASVVVHAGIGTPRLTWGNATTETLPVAKDVGVLLRTEKLIYGLSGTFNSFSTTVIGQSVNLRYRAIQPLIGFRAHENVSFGMGLVFATVNGTTTDPSGAENLSTVKTKSMLFRVDGHLDRIGLYLTFAPDFWNVQICGGVAVKLGR